MRITNSKTYQIVIFLIFLLFAFACAKQVGLTGGPVDKDPPVIISMEPDNGSTNFSESIIRVYFDEYIRLNNINQKLIISPPIETKPDISIRGKSIQIKLKTEELEANTTYCLNFNDAIADNNENNALHSFIYAFSTGDYIDSLTVSGNVIDAYTKQPVKDAYVLLHNNLSDTAFNTIKPVYLSKVNDKGEFKIPFLKEGDYNIFAIEDANFNFMFDVAEEKIAFLDSVIRPSATIIYEDAFEKPDNEEDDSSKIIKKELVKYSPDEITLLLFEEDHQKQYFKDKKRLNRNKISLLFNRKQYKDFNIKVKNDESAIVIYNESPDTVDIWLLNPDIISSDTVFVYASYISPFDNDSLIYDTIRISSPDIPEYKDSVLSITGSDKKHPKKDYKLKLSAPVDSFDNKNISFGVFEDSIFMEQAHAIKIDSTNPLYLILDAEFYESKSYTLILNQGFARSIYDLENLADTISIKLIPEDKFGHLHITIPDSTGHYLIQMLKGDKIIYEAVPLNGIADFGYINPDKYKLQVIFDDNQNRRWDTGNYSQKIQPEKILFYPEELEIRASWTHEIDWNFLNSDEENKKEEETEEENEEETE